MLTPTTQPQSVPGWGDTDAGLAIGGVVAADEARHAAPRLDAALLVVALAVFVVLGIGYASLTPLWQNPDEPAHYNYVAFVARSGGLPELREGDWDSALLERLKNGRLQAGDSIEAIRYESWQPPLFYVLAAPVFRLGPSDVGSVVARLRIFDLGLGALTLVVAYLVARHVLPGLAAALPLSLAGVPMFTAVSASVSADPLANLLAATVLLVLLQRLHGAAARDGPRWPVLAGGLLGLGVLTKLALTIFVPLALAVVLVRSSHRVRDALLMLGVAGVIVAPWLVHQVTTYGWADPLATARHAAVVADQPRFPGLTPEYVARALTTTFHSFWAQFGWMAALAPERLYWLYGGVCLVAAAGLVRARRALGQAAWRLCLGTFGAAVLAYVGYNLSFEQFQGRYLFTALVPAGLLLVAGWAAWLPRRLQLWGTLAVAALLVAANAYALLRVLVPAFAPAA